MIGSVFISIGFSILTLLPIISLPIGFVKALGFLTNVIWFVNIFLPLKALTPIILFILLVRNFNIVMSFVNWVIRLIPFVG